MASLNRRRTDSEGRRLGCSAWCSSSRSVSQRWACSRTTSSRCRYRFFAGENVGPLLVYVGLLVWLRSSGGASAARVALLLWTLLNLVVGGILSILLIPILPFVPDQTLGHYLAHAIYALTQVPLLWLLIRPTRTIAVA